MTDEELDPLARRELRAAHKQVQDYAEHLSAAYAATVRAKGNGGPDFSPRVQTLMESVSALLDDINGVAPPFEPHAAQRGEVPARPESTVDTLPEHHARRHSTR
jgi:hypothetical protein